MTGDVRSPASAFLGGEWNNYMGKHAAKPDPMTRRTLLSLLVGGTAAAGVTLATSGKLYQVDELERRLAAAPAPSQTFSTQTSSSPSSAGVRQTGTRTSPEPSPVPTTSIVPTTTSAPPTTVAKRPEVVLKDELAEQPRSGYGMQPLAAASAHLIATVFGIVNVGGYRATSAIAGSDHPKGLAADFMTPNRILNRTIGNFAIVNRNLLRVKYAISLQHYNDGSGWTLMEDRGSTTANHFDHCHVSFY